MNVIKMKGPLEPYLVHSQGWLNAFPIHLCSRRPSFLSPHSLGHFSKAARAHYLQRNMFFFLIITGQNVTRSNCAQSPNTAHGGKIPSVLKNLSSIFNIRYAHHCFQQWNFSLFSYFLWLSCCVNTLLNHVMVLEVNYRHAPPTISQSVVIKASLTLSHLKYNK